MLDIASERSTQTNEPNRCATLLPVLSRIDTTVRNGYRGIEIRIAIEGDAAADELRQVVERSVARSAVFDVLTNGTSVAVEVETP